MLVDFVEKKAALLPLGGIGEELSGHKGYGYATAVEILSAALQDGSFLKDLAGLDILGNKIHFNVGHFFIAIDPEFFMGLDTFKIISTAICAGLRESDKAPSEMRIYTAGEKEFEAEKVVREKGVPLNRSIQEDLIFMRNELDLEGYTFEFEDE